MPKTRLHDTFAGSLPFELLTSMLCLNPRKCSLLQPHLRGFFTLNLADIDSKECLHGVAISMRHAEWQPKTYCFVTQNGLF